MPDNMFAIHGHKIKIAGDNPTRITGITPNTGHAQNRIEIHTQYSGMTDRFLKTPRTITSSFTIEQA
jgi:hypothetical protein